MNSISRQYLFGTLFIAFGGYQAYRSELLESYLYALAGITFIVNALALEPKLAKYKISLSIITWILIGATGLYFLYLLRYKFY